MVLEVSTVAGDQAMTVSKEAYEQNYQQFRSLNQIMWQIPVLAMTLTGGRSGRRRTSVSGSNASPVRLDHDYRAKHPPRAISCVEGRRNTLPNRRVWDALRTNSGPAGKVAARKASAEPDASEHLHVPGAIHRPRYSCPCPL